VAKTRLHARCTQAEILFTRDRESISLAWRRAQVRDRCATTYRQGLRLTQYRACIVCIIGKLRYYVNGVPPVPILAHTFLPGTGEGQAEGG
jgi:hypothetical protein